MVYSGIVTIIGLVGFIFILLYLFKILKQDKDYDVAVDIFRLILLFVALGSLILIPKISLDNQTVCETVVANSTYVNSTFTDYDYNHYCYNRSDATPNTFFKSVSFSWYIIMIFVIGFLAWRALIFLFESFGWKMKRGQNDDG